MGAEPAARAVGVAAVAPIGVKGPTRDGGGIPASAPTPPPPSVGKAGAPTAWVVFKPRESPFFIFCWRPGLKKRKNEKWISQFHFLYSWYRSPTPLREP